MTAVPRLRDTVTILRTEDGSFQVTAPGDSPAIPLSDSGFDLLCRMDGVSTESEVRQAFSERWQTELSADELAGWIAELDQSNAFVRDTAAIKALGHLKSQGIRFRGARPDRRTQSREEDRRQDSGPRAQWFNHAVMLLNDGYVEQSANLFQRFAAECPADIRIQELNRHLQNIVSGALAGSPERRDITWEVFDTALRNFLDVGSCPSCGTALDIELGDLNRCYQCGSSFSSFVLEASREDRRKR